MNPINTPSFVAFLVVSLLGGTVLAGTMTPDYTKPNYANSPPLRKFVDALPGVGPAAANNLGQYIPVAVADAATFAQSDYYEIALVDYNEQMHSDLPGPYNPATPGARGTRLRGYVQLETPVVVAKLAAAGTPSGHVALTYPSGAPILNRQGNQVYAVDRPHYLGPLIVSQSNRPVRVKFVNLLPVAANGGDLFLPVDTTLMGAGMGPYGMTPPVGPMDYTQNRATLHLHGGTNVWISDGTPHQWTAPAGEVTAYPKGLATQNVPDMFFDANGNLVPAETPGATTDPGPGAMTFYWSNQDSCRLQFYHDHAYGITRLNVYAGEAAAFLITDSTEQAMVASGVIPALQVPLVIQDKTFVPDTAALAANDPLWDTAKWGGLGNLWFPHVYQPDQNPDGTINPLGRWDYSLWVWPPMPAVTPLPAVSTTPESFSDTPVINGTAYPYLNVEPRRYRFRILNASNDRSFNLQLYYAQSNELDDPLSGEPDLTAPNPPAFIQIGTEGGFLPAPVVLNNPPQQIGFNPENGNVNQVTLLLNPAVRADLIVDFSSVAPGTNLILYNDCPAAMPGGDDRYDYYTDDPDQTEDGGAPPTVAGFGPNTRTLMQFRVVAPTLPPDPYTYATNLPVLQAQLPPAFAATQPDALVPPGIYGDNASTTLSFDGQVLPIHMKSINMSFDMFGRLSALLGTEEFSPDMGWMANPMGYIEEPTEILPEGETQIWMIVNNDVDTHPVHFHLFNVQLINRVDWSGNILPPDPNEAGWKETVRVNPMENTLVALKPVRPDIPFQVPNSIRPLDVTMPATGPLGSRYDPLTNPNPVTDFGWEYVWHCHILGHEENDFMRPMVLQVAPAMPANLVAAMTAPQQVDLTWTDQATNETGFRIERATGSGAFTTLNTVAANVTTYRDTTVAFNTAYRYRVIAFNTFDSPPSNIATVVVAVPAAPSNLSATPSVLSLAPPSVRLAWTDHAANETGFTIQRASNASFKRNLTTFTVGANMTTFTDTTVAQRTRYYYRVMATNPVGNSAFSNPANAVTAGQLPAAPGNLTLAGIAQTALTLSWMDYAVNEQGFYVERSNDAGLTWKRIATRPANRTAAPALVTYKNSGLKRGANYSYRVQAYNINGTSVFSNVAVARTLP